MTGLQLARALLDTAKRAERSTEDELVRLKERLEQQRQHRMMLEELFEKMEAEQP